MNTAPSSSTFFIVVLLSGKGSNLQAILNYIQQQQLNIKISAVICDRSEALGLEIAKQHGVATFYINPKDFATRQAFDLALQNQISSLPCDLIVLAGFMRILSADFVNYFAGKLINIHPSLLPKFKGLNTHQRVLDANEKTHGCTVHYVSAELDNGPIIAQSQFNVQPSDDATTLQKKVHALEHKLYPQVIQSIAEKKSQEN